MLAHISGYIAQISVTNLCYVATKNTVICNSIGFVAHEVTEAIINNILYYQIKETGNASINFEKLLVVMPSSALLDKLLNTLIYTMAPSLQLKFIGEAIVGTATGLISSYAVDEIYDSYDELINEKIDIPHPQDF